MYLQDIREGTIIVARNPDFVRRVTEPGSKNRTAGPERCIVGSPDTAESYLTVCICVYLQDVRKGTVIVARNPNFPPLRLSRS